MIEGEIKMNVSEQIINVLNDLCQKFGIAIDWSAANVLPYLKELCSRFINYEIYTSVFWMILIPIICIMFWIVFASTFKKAKEVHWDDYYFISFVNIFAGALAIGFSIVSIIVIGCQTFDIIEAIYLPEKTIYNFINYQISLYN